MTQLGPVALIKQFVRVSGAKEVGRVGVTSWGATQKLEWRDLFRVLDYPVLVMAVDSDRFLGSPQSRIISEVNDVFRTNKVDADRFAVVLATSTRRTTALNGILKQVPLAGHHRRIIPAGRILAAAKRANSLEAIRKLILERTDLRLLNPYRSDIWTPENMFFGRKAVRNDIVSRRGHEWVYGPRRIGKSSLAQQIQRELGVVHLNSGKQVNRASYVDVATLHDPNESLFNEILKGFGLSLGELRTPAKVKRIVGGKVEGDYEAGAILDVLIRQFEGRLVIILDEIDKWLHQAHLGERSLAALNRLKALTHNRRARVILVGYEHLMEAVNDESFPFSGRGRPVFLGATDRENAEELITKPLGQLRVALCPHNDVMQRIWDASQGRPNVLQELCRDALVDPNIANVRERVITPQIIDRVIEHNEACAKLATIVQRLRFHPLARALAILALTFDGAFKKRELLDTLPDELDGYMPDIDLSLRTLRIRLVFASDDTEQRWEWANDRARAGTAAYVKTNGRERLLKSCVNEYQDGGWKRELWRQHAEHD